MFTHPEAFGESNFTPARGALSPALFKEPGLTTGPLFLQKKEVFKKVPEKSHASTFVSNPFNLGGGGTSGSHPK